MEINYKSLDDTDDPIRKNINNIISEDTVSSEFDEFQKKVIEFHHFYMDSDEKLNTKIIEQSTLILNQMKEFLHQKYDYGLLLQPLQFIFGLPKIIIKNKYNELEDEYYINHFNSYMNRIDFLDLERFIFSFTDFIYEYTKISSDIDCFKLISTEYISTLIIILKKVQSPVILFSTAKCFINLLEQKPLVGQYIPYKLLGYIFNNYVYYICKEQMKKNIYFDKDSKDFEYQKLSLKFALLEAYINFEVFLPDHYQKALEIFTEATPSQLCNIIMRILNSSLQKDDVFAEFKDDFIFNMIDKIFHNAKSLFISGFLSEDFIKLLNNFLGIDYNFKYDMQILFCFSRIAEQSAICAINVVIPEFCQYRPYKFNGQEDDYCDKRLIIAYCNLWVTIIGSLNGPTQLFIARRRSMEKLHKNVDSIIEMTSIILDQQKNDYDFDMIKATTLIHVALINSKNNEIIKKILTSLTDVTDRIQQLIDEADPKNAISISNAIEVLYNFANTIGASDFPDLSTWLRNEKLIESLSDVQSTLIEDGVSCQEIQNVIEKLQSINPSNQ